MEGGRVKPDGKVEVSPFHSFKEYADETLHQNNRGKLLANGRNRDQDHAPVVKIFNPMGSATWLLSELDEDGNFFGLC